MPYTQFLYSGGINNARGDLSLGGGISDFIIPDDNTLNNLFDDITVGEQVVGLTDYRCFYVKNPASDLFLTAITLSLDPKITGSEITMGVIFQDDIQRLLFLGGNPDPTGYLILSCEFGNFKVDYGGSFAAMTANLQAALNLLPYCSGCTATLTAGPPAYIDIHFSGDCGYRNTDLLQIAANRLQNTQGGAFIIDTYAPGNPYNGTGDSLIQVTDQIDTSSFDPVGTLYVFLPSLDGYVALAYDSIVPPRQFHMTIPLTFDLLIYDALFINPIDTKKYLVKVSKISQGSPIQTEADVNINDTTAPSGVVFSSTDIDLETIFALESFPVWIKRKTIPASPPLPDDTMTCNIDATAVTP